ncbi:F-box/LRR-repeat protein 25 [Linum grandiflorum]
MMKNEEAVSPAAAVVDRISELPDEIIHLILRSLNTHEEAGRSSILSRRWLHLWSTYPVVDFHYHPNEKLTSFRFESFAAATSKRLQLALPPLLLDTFNVTLGYFFVDEWTKRRSLLCAKLLLQSGSNRSPFKVVLKNNLPNSSSSLDPIGLFMNCGRTRFLDLTRFDLSRWGSSETCLDNLQELCLEDVQVTEESFPSRLASARRLEKLSLKSIRGIHILDISASNFPSLKSLSFRDSCLDGVVLQLNSAQLQTVCFEGDTKLLTLVSAPNVTSLELVPFGEIRRQEFDGLISKLPSLESLDFDARSVTCYNDPHDRLSISAHTLRKFTLVQRDERIEFEIDAPNLMKKTDRRWCWRRRFRHAKITCVTVDDISTINKPMKSQPSVNIIIKLPANRRCLYS